MPKTSRKDNTAPLPTPAELDILAILWRLGPSTVREVHEVLEKGSGYTTTLKQMQLMTEKGLLARSERFRSHLYEPAIPKEQTQRRIAADMLNRVFEGSAKHLVLGALTAGRASRDELKEIRDLLAKHEKEERRKR